MKRWKKFTLGIAAVTATAVYAPALLAVAPTPGEAFTRWRDNTGSGREASAFWESFDDRYGDPDSSSLNRALDQARRISPDEKAGGGIRPSGAAGH